MAPPTPVYSRVEIRSMYKKYLDDPKKYQCKLKLITQHECTFKINTVDRSQPPEIICLPFKRIFQHCLIQKMVKENNKKKSVDKWVNFEVTDLETNSDMTEDSPKYGDDVREFLNADKSLRKLMEIETGT